jgi:DHA2 family multidrug resistance protein-like MFS transporter
VISDGLPAAERRRAYFALATATSMAVLDETIANVALPTIGRDMHVSAAATVWVVNAFQLALTAALFTWSSFGQARGLARGWRYGIALFTLGSLGCALSPTLPLLVLARLLQGVGAAGIMSLSPALLRVIFPRAQLGRALGVNSLVIATGIAAGPTIGGAILAIASWPWLFLINVPIGIVVALATRNVFAADDGHGGRVHVPSMLTSALGFGLIVYGIDGFGRHEPWPLIVAELVAGFASFGWFLARQRHLERPMFAVDLYARPLFALASLAGFLAFTGSTLAIVALPFLFQDAMGASPLQSGLLMTSWPVAMGLAANVAGPLSDRYSAAVLSTTGSVILAVGLALYALLPLHASVITIVAIGALCGAGFGIFQAPNSRELMRNAPRAQTASAAAIMAATRVGGQTCGAAALAVVFSAFSASAEPGGVGGAFAAHAAVSGALWTAFCLTAITAVASSVRFGVAPTTASAEGTTRAPERVA